LNGQGRGRAAGAADGETPGVPDSDAFGREAITVTVGRVGCESLSAMITVAASGLPTM